MALQQEDSADGFQQQQPRKRPHKRKRLYIGNLPPPSPQLASQLRDWLQATGSIFLSTQAIVVQDNGQSCHALINLGEQSLSMDSIISKLHNGDFQGRRLVVQRDQPRQNMTRSRRHPHGSTQTFASSSWAKPRTLARAETERKNKPKETRMDVSASAKEAHAFGKQSLADLLADYGEQDTDWKKTVVPEETDPFMDTSEPTKHSVLGQHGKAPIHVCVTSFGYRHGAPPDVGWSYAQPLGLLDVRHLETVPPYMAWQHGLSATVKYTLLRQDKEGLIQQLSNKTAVEVAQALEAAIQEGGYGYAMPLNMQVFIGSENGQHRSVVVAEQVAMAIRKQLRENATERFGVTVKVSVGTEHRDMERKSRAVSSKPKQKDMEDEW